MSTRALVSNASFTALGRTAIGCMLVIATLASCSRESVSYIGLDLPTADTGPVSIGAFATLSGADSRAGRAFEDALHAEILAINAHGGVLKRSLELALYDDRGTVAGARLAASRLADVQKVIVMFAGPDTARTLEATRTASKTPIVCVGVGRETLVRRGTFTLQPRAPSGDFAAQAIASARWVARSFVRAKTYGPADVLSALRTTSAPDGYELVEGQDAH